VVKSRPELVTVNNQQETENLQLAEIVAEMVGATSTEGFLV